MGERGEVLRRYRSLREQLDPRGIRLVVVTKEASLEAVRWLYEEGHRDFGENRLASWREKREQLPGDVRWHWIGYLQRNKVRYVAGNVTLIHSVDREPLMEALQKRAASRGIPEISCLLQVKIAREETKHGMPPDEAWKWFTERKFTRYPHLRFCGLMGMATYTDNLSQVRSEFRLLKSLFDQIRSALGWIESFTVLSMGMSHDWEIAVEEGATLVRIGQYIFRGTRG